MAKKVAEVKDEKKTAKEELKEKKAKAKEAIVSRQAEVEEKIDALYDKLDETKEKASKKEIKKEIKELKKQREEIGKKDTFLRDVKKEMKLVRWPSKTEVVKYSLACLIFVLFFALFYYGIDALFALVTGLFNK